MSALMGPSVDGGMKMHNNQCFCCKNQAAHSWLDKKMTQKTSHRNIMCCMSWNNHHYHILSCSLTFSTTSYPSYREHVQWWFPFAMYSFLGSAAGHRFSGWRRSEGWPLPVAAPCWGGAGPTGRFTTWKIWSMDDLGLPPFQERPSYFTHVLVVEALFISMVQANV